MPQGENDSTNRTIDIDSTSIAPGLQDSGRLYQRVAEKLTEAIRSGEFKMGARLPAERKLAERFAVSRPTVREAIIALEIAGCVEVKGGSGVYVTSNSASNLNTGDLDIGLFEILEARLLFESEAAAIAARVITEDEVQALQDTLQSMNTEPEQVSEHEDRFHLLIARATHNEAIISVCKHLWSLRNNSRVSACIPEQVRKAGASDSITEYRRITEAIRQRDPSAAREAMRDHFGRVVEQLLETTEALAIEEARRQVNQERRRFDLVR